MRDILFRGKRTNTGELVYGDLVHGIEKHRGRIFIWSEADYIPTGIDEFEVIPETVGQYSGWKDKKGQKIFEGDIVEIEPHGYIPTLNRGVVIFRDGCFGIEYLSDVARKFGWEKTFHRIGTISEWRDMGASGTVTYTYEVLGNIYDNPELLEEKTHGQKL